VTYFTKLKIAACSLYIVALSALFFPNIGFSHDALQGIDLIQKDKIPKHVCLIMNGNRRWAEKRGLSASEGHWEGVQTAARMFKCAAQLGIQTMTLSVLTKEHVQGERSEDELEEFIKMMTLGSLWWLNGGAAALKFPNAEGHSLDHAIRIKFIGDLSTLPRYLQDNFERLERTTADNSEMTIVFPVAYTGRDEIKRALFKMMEDIEKGSLPKEGISNEVIESYLDTAGIPNVDLFIYTGGSHWVNNAWHLYNAECFFYSILWPDFCEQDLVDAIIEFQQRAP
jgi:undecaprenyl diphosphate synthase